MFGENQEELFLDEAKRGINLFLGSGFSVLEDKFGNKLPTASQLCEDVYREFDIDRIYGNDLYTISELAPRYEYQFFCGTGLWFPKTQLMNCTMRWIC